MDGTVDCVEHQPSRESAECSSRPSRRTDVDGRHLRDSPFLVSFAFESHRRRKLRPFYCTKT